MLKFLTFVLQEKERDKISRITFFIRTNLQNELITLCRLLSIITWLWNLCMLSNAWDVFDIEMMQVIRRRTVPTRIAVVRWGLGPWHECSTTRDEFGRGHIRSQRKDGRQGSINESAKKRIVSRHNHKIVPRSYKNVTFVAQISR